MDIHWFRSRYHFYNLDVLISLLWKTILIRIDHCPIYQLIGDLTGLVDPTGFVNAFRDLSCQVHTQEHGVLLIPRSGALNEVIGCCACFRDLSCQVQTQEHGVLLIPRSGALSMYEE